MSALITNRKSVLLGFLGAQKLHIILLSITSIIMAMMVPVVAFLSSGFIDFLVIFDSKLDATLAELNEIGAYLVICIVILVVLARLKSIVASVVYNKLASDSLLGAFEHVQQNSHMYFTDNDPDDISAEITYFSKITVRTLTTIFDQLLPLFFMAIGSLLLLVYVDKALSITIMVSITFLMITSFFISKISPENVLKEDKLEEEIDYKIYDTLDNHLSVMLNHSYETERRKVAESLARSV